MKSERFYFLDGLRGVAAIAVVAFHRRWLLPDVAMTDMLHGYLAVDFFFLLSGFVIAHAYERKLQSGWSFREFVKARLIRTHPLLVIGTALGLVPAILGYEIFHGWLASAVAIVGLPVFGIDHVSPFPLNAPVWSLFWELVINFAFALAIGLLTRRVLLALLMITGPALVLVWFTHGTDVGFAYRDWWLGGVRCAFPFLFGVLLCRLHAAGHLAGLRAPWWLLAGLLVAVLAAPLDKSWRIPVAAVGCLLVFPLVVAAGTQVQLGPRLSRVAKVLGELSYPIYLLHYPIIRILEPTWKASGIPNGFFVPVVVVITCVLGWAVLQLYDKPVRAWLNRRALQTA